MKLLSILIFCFMLGISGCGGGSSSGGDGAPGGGGGGELPIMQLNQDRFNESRLG